MMFSVFSDRVLVMADVKLSELKKLPLTRHEDWVAPKPSIADVDLHIAQGELVL